MITLQDIRGLIAVAIRNNKQAFINAMNANGFYVPQSISEDDLYSAGLKVLLKNGVNAAIAVLSRVPVNKSQVTAQEKTLLTAKFAPTNQRTFGDWFNNTVTFFGDLIGGSSVSTTAPVVQNQTSVSALSPLILGATVVAGLVMIAIFRKFAVVVVGIIVIVMAVVLYGIFAKTTSTTVSGGGTTTTGHGGIGDTISSFFGTLLALLPK